LNRSTILDFEINQELLGFDKQGFAVPPQPNDSAFLNGRIGLPQVRGRDGLTGPATIGIAIISFVLLLATKLDTLWMILGAAIVSLTLSSVGLVALI